jgi:hypothetical protein
MGPGARFPTQFRAKYSRDKNGCLNCRQRRKKCDGIKPACGLCSRNYRQCQWPLADNNADVSDSSSVVEPSSPAPSQICKECIKRQDPPIAGVPSPSANRQQLFNTFLSSYIPSNILPGERGGSVYLMYFGFVEELARTQYDYPVLTAAMSALSLVSVGSMTNNPGMLRKSSDEYSLAVSRLAIAVQRPQSACDDSLLAAIMVLATCEFYQLFRENSEAKGYYSHIHGLHSLLAVRGPQPPKTRVASLVLAKAKASSISKSMLIHQENFHDACGWRELELNIPSLDQDRSSILGYQISRLLLRSDRLKLDLPDSLLEIDKTLQDAVEVEAGLRSQLDQQLAYTGHTVEDAFTVEPIENFARFCELVKDRTLATAHRFPSYCIAYLFTSYWQRVSMVRTVVKTLQAKRCLLSKDELPTYANGFGTPVTESELRQYVILVCHNIPFLAEPECVCAGDICSIMPLSMISKYFAACGDVKWSAWAEDVRKHLFVRGVNFPASQLFAQEEKSAGA